MLRGVNRDAIFLEDADRERFLTALRAARDASGFSILAFCLMDNHVHLVLRAGAEPIGTGVKRLGVRYAGWFNRKYDRVGHLFQDRFKSVPVDDDAHLVSLLRYVWNNPVEAGLVDHADAYRWSSRRLFGQPSNLIDSAMLDQLLDGDPLTSEGAGVPSLGDPPSRSGPRSRFSDDEVARLLEEACGARSPEDFRLLDAATSRRAIHELRTRSVPYSQLARLTGVSSTALKRLQAAGAAAA